MEHYVWLALAATLGTWFVTALGAATVVFFKSPSARALNLMLGFSAGVMIAASCLACGGIRVPAGGAVPVGVG